MSVTEVETKLGYAFADRELLLQALTHRSWSRENGGSDYERLEFLGDAVLQACSTSELYRRFPSLHEGQLQPLRAQFVCEPALAEIGRALGVGQAVRLGVGEQASGGRFKPRLLADLVESLLGAMFLEAGFDPVLAVVSQWMDAHPFSFGADALLDNPRGKLQELTEGRWKVPPRYAVAQIDGPAHAPVFVAEVRIHGAAVARAVGASKAGAMKLAAQIAYLRLEPRDQVDAGLPPCHDEPRLPETPTSAPEEASPLDALEPEPTEGA